MKRIIKAVWGGREGREVGAVALTHSLDRRLLSIPYLSSQVRSRLHFGPSLAKGGWGFESYVIGP